jgi:tyrosine-protein kinase Etk/Wzc
LEHLHPVQDSPGIGKIDQPPYETVAQDGQSAHSLVEAWLSELRRRWLLALIAALCVLLPVAAFALLAVPKYSATGVLQVSSQGSTINPLLELAGASAPSEVETEVEIIRRREFILRALKKLRLQLADPHQPSFATTDLDVALSARSPVSPILRRARRALASLDVAPTVFGTVPVVIDGLRDERVAIRIGSPETQRSYEVGIGEPVVDESLTIVFAEIPLDAGETFEFEALSDGALVESLAENVSVSSVGSARQSTNLVQIRFTDPDRETAQAVVQTIMQQYLDQSLDWQTKSASNSADFIAKRLEEAQEQLLAQEKSLQQFAEDEHAVQLDTQAEVTIESAAELESEKRKIELQERVIGTVLAGLKRNSSGSAHLTSNFFEDPVLSAAVGALTEAETQYAVLRATLTDDHPAVIGLGSQIKRHQKEIQRLLRSAQKNLTQQRKDLEARIVESMDSLSAYPEKELKLARHMRDVEVNQKLYGFLLEKFQEAQILEASTTIDKRIVDTAALPHRKTSPQRAKLVITGGLGGLAFAFFTVYLAHLLQRKLATIEAVKNAIPYPVYGTTPAIDNKTPGKRQSKTEPERRLVPAAVWSDTHGAAAESFRALAVNISLAPAVPGRGRIVQVTSSQPGEGKSTIASNLAVALASSGAKTLIIDLDLRKPVQHRAWGIRRGPGYSDLIAQAGGPKQARSLLQHNETFNVDILTAGPRLPDTLGALMGDTLESMLAYWSEQYDYVIVDSPPVFVAGTAIIGRHADLVIVVARPGVTERATARHGLELLSRLPGHKGLVLNGVERKHAESYYYGGAYNYAATYGAAADDDDGDQQAAS